MPPMAVQIFNQLWCLGLSMHSKPVAVAVAAAVAPAVIAFPRFFAYAKCKIDATKSSRSARVHWAPKCPYIGPADRQSCRPIRIRCTILSVSKREILLLWRKLRLSTAFYRRRVIRRRVRHSLPHGIWPNSSLHTIFPCRTISIHIPENICSIRVGNSADKTNSIISRNWVNLEFSSHLCVPGLRAWNVKEEANINWRSTRDFNLIFNVY